MRYRYTETTYHFQVPLPPKQKQFSVFKALFEMHPEYSIAPERDFWKKFNPILIILASLLVVPLLFLIKSMSSYNEYLDAKDAYFALLKRMIIESQDYSIFIERYLEQYPNVFWNTPYLRTKEIWEQPFSTDYLSLDRRPEIQWKKFREDFFNN